MKPFLTKFGALPILLVIGYGFIALRGPQGVPALLEKRRQIQELERRNSELARDIDLKRERIDRLRQNQAEQELEVRQRLKLVRPGEKVFILQDQATKRP